MKPTAIILLVFFLFLSTNAQTASKNDSELKNTFNFKEEIINEHNIDSENHLPGNALNSGKATTAESSEAVKLNNLGAESFFNKKFDDAARLFREAANLSPEYVQIQINLANALLNGKHYAQAADICRMSIDKNVQSGSLYSILGSALYESGSYTESVEAYQNSLKVTRQAATFNDLGIALHRLGESQTALAAFENSLKIKPVFPDALNNYGVALLKLNRRQEAVQKFLEAIKQKPNFAAAHNNLGTAYFDAGKKKQALKSFSEAVRIAPEYGSAHYNLGIGYLDEGKRDKARGCLEILKKIDAGLAQKFQKEFYKDYVIDVTQGA